MKLFKKSPQRSVTKYLTILVTLLLLFCVGGCGDLKKSFDFTSIDEEGNVVSSPKSELPAKTLLQQGMDDYGVGKYFTAIEAFQNILDRYPFSSEATLAELKVADCSYYLDRYAEALVQYEEFENRHPTNESMAYVMFQKGMCNYKQIDRIDRDTAGAVKSIELFKQLLKAYPNSPYNDAARARITAATEFLAEHEYFVVEYYVRAAKYDQAKVRLKYLLALYPETKIAANAKDLLTRIEAGNPPKSKLTAWFPKLNLSDWKIFGRSDEADSSAGPIQR